MATFACVIVNYRTPELALTAIGSVIGNGESVVKIIVVDNASGDHSREVLEGAILQRQWQTLVTLINAPRNGGFAYGCNLGATEACRHTPPDFVIFLNPDAELSANAINEFAHAFVENKSLGIVGATVRSPDGSIQSAPHRFPGIRTELTNGARLGILDRVLLGPPAYDNNSNLVYCDWVSGACLAVRTEVWLALKGMDEKYFLYFEEVDFCWRAKKAQWKIAVTSRATAIHSEGASTGITSVARRRPPYWFASRRRFFVVHYGRFGLFAADLCWSIGRLSWRLRRLLSLGAKDHATDPPQLMRDILIGDCLFLLKGKRV